MSTRRPFLHALGSIAALAATLHVPYARADPNNPGAGIFLNCLQQHGIVVTDSAKEIDHAVHIQKALKAGIPMPDVISYIQAHWDDSAAVANAETICAALTMMY
jgi:hypothetical protein